MVEGLNSWAQKIIVVVIICTILELILPEGKNKKYIKTVIGIYVIFTIISPIVSKLNNGSIDLNKYFNLDYDDNLTIETSSNIDTNEYIENVYKEKLKEDIKLRISNINYVAEKIDIEINTEGEATYGAILSLNLRISKKQSETKNEIKIENIVIEKDNLENESNISVEEKEQIKQYLATIYYMDSKNINIE